MRSARVGQALAAVAALVAGIWLLELLSFYIGGGRHSQALEQLGILPRRLSELSDIFTAPFVHKNFDHVMANTVPLAVLGALTALRGLWRLAVVSLIVIVVGGLGAWLISPPFANTLGASILVFGYFGYLLAHGFIDRSPMALVIAVLVAVLYGSMIVLVLPVQPEISWQGHLFGLLGGVLAAWLLRRGGPTSWQPAQGTGGRGYRP